MPAFVWNTRVRYADTDTSGRIHYTSLFRYFEAAEQEFLRAIRHAYSGQHSGQSGAEIGWPRVHAECDVSGPLVFDDEIGVEVSVSRLGNSSFELSFRILKEDREHAHGRVVIVCLDRKTQRSRPLPVEFAEALRSRMEPKEG
jgi:YbgC/YbaW family acyl-CoA thioester hydrolase